MRQTLREEVTPYTPYDQLPQYLTMRQAANFTQQSYWSITQAVNEGRIPHTNRFSKKLKLIPREHFRPVELPRTA